MTKQTKTTKGQTIKTRTPKKALPLFILKRINEGGIILLLSATLFLLLSLFSYEGQDPGLFSSHTGQAKVMNAGGQVGAYIADAFYYLFGYFSLALPLSLAYALWRVLKEHRETGAVNRMGLGLRLAGIAFFMISGCSLFSFNSVISGQEPVKTGGGWLGNFVAGGFDYALNVQGALLLLLAIFLVGVTCLTGLSWLKVVEQIGVYAILIMQSFWRGMVRFLHGKERTKEPVIDTARAEKAFASIRIGEEAIITPQRERKEKTTPLLAPKPLPLPEVEYTVIDPAPELPKAYAKPSPSPSPNPAPPITPPAVIASKMAKGKNIGALPSLTLLDKGTPGKPMGGYSHQELEGVSRELEQHLLDFGIQADVVAVHPGPVITRFEVQLAAGIKVSK